MKTIVLLRALFIANLIYSQNKICGISNIQFQTYDFAKVNLNKINEHIDDKNSLIEVSIEMTNREVTKIIYHQILPENHYSGENKSEIEIWEGLKKFMIKTVKNEIKKCSNFNYEKVIFRIPISKENIEKTINEVNANLIQIEKEKIENGN